MSLRDLLRFHWMPGTDLFTRRRVGLESHWAHGSRKVLDAGCGNGWFAYRACRGDATVTAVAISAGLVARGAAFYNDYLGIPPTRLRFVELNLYDLPNLGETYDEIICYETLEHIRDDRRVCEHFFAALNPGGTLHLCCPNADHPRWAAEVLDDEEQGGHVRCGYTEASYRALLEPLGFEIGEIDGGRRRDPGVPPGVGAVAGPPGSRRGRRGSGSPGRRPVRVARLTPTEDSILDLRESGSTGRDADGCCIDAGRWRRASRMSNIAHNVYYVKYCIAELPDPELRCPAPCPAHQKKKAHSVRLFSLGRDWPVRTRGLSASATVAGRSGEWHMP